MRRWLAVHERLEQQYRAPQILDWVDVPGTEHSGLLFEHIDGSTWDIDSRPDLMNEIASLLLNLHEDDELVRALGDPGRTYRECWELRYREQFYDLERAEFGPPGLSYPSVSALVELTRAKFQREDFSQPRDVHPLYLRLSDAEMNWVKQAR